MEETITITLEEYKELLIIKGKYEELKSQEKEKTIIWNTPSLDPTYTEPIIEPYKVTCMEEGK